MKIKTAIILLLAVAVFAACNGKKDDMNDSSESETITVSDQEIIASQDEVYTSSAETADILTMPNAEVTASVVGEIALQTTEDIEAIKEYYLAKVDELDANGEEVDTPAEESEGDFLWGYKGKYKDDRDLEILVFQIDENKDIYIVF